MTSVWTIASIVAGVAISAEIHNFKLRKCNKELKEAFEAASSALGVCALSTLDIKQLSNTETFMEERMEPIPHFAVYRQGLTEKIDLLRIGYKADDPDDREYKRIFAQERVDALNEKP